MKLIIAGGRAYFLTKQDYAYLDALNKATPITEVVCGGATGVDDCGNVWARGKKIPVRLFIPEWRRYGHAAGPVRNTLMAKYADAVVLFPGGSGTKSMRKEAIAAGITIYEPHHAQP